MNHSIQIPIGRPLSSQAMATALVAATLVLNPDLPALEWNVAPDGSVRGTHAKAPDAEVHAALTVWAALFGEPLRTLGSCRADRRTYGVEIAHGSVAVFLSGVGLIDTVEPPAPVLPAELAHIEQPVRLPILTRQGGAAHMTQAQLDGTACVRCGLADPVCSTPVAVVSGYGQALACSPACPVPQPDPTDPVEDAPQPHPDWIEVDSFRHERTVIGVTWALGHHDETEVRPDEEPTCGWFLFGPEGSVYAGGRFLIEHLDEALPAADRAIAEWAVAQAVAIFEQRRPSGDADPVDSADSAPEQCENCGRSGATHRYVTGMWVCDQCGPSSGVLVPQQRDRRAEPGGSY
ncbi:hypothetical protein ACIRL2_29250 [Embleya sp. NPDC127516]|uniref:hypothetical protein n=1 Tax=Embleya sp. NPDC127516 TaxID=3363990 RepID=UPI00380F424B